jgi:NSS family neurotransmitter:Na+ symporter
MVAISSGLIIFPACFAFGITPDSGPSLIFITLPNVFINMPLGRAWGTLFFLFMTFASFSTVTAVFQNIIASCTENFKWSKKKAVLINLAVIFGGSIPTVLGYNLLEGFLIGGRDVLDFEDFIVSSILLPLGSLVFLLFTVSNSGWGFKKYLEECNTGRGFKMKKWMLPYLRYVLPILIIVIFVTGLISA